MDVAEYVEDLGSEERLQAFFVVLQVAVWCQRRHFFVSENRPQEKWEVWVVVCG